MANTEEIKAQLLRGAVQDNIDVIHGFRARKGKRRKNRNQIWLWGGLFSAGIAYFTIASAVIPELKTPTPTAIPGTDSPQSKVSSSDSDLLLSPPKPIDRKAIPLMIKTVVIDAGHGGEPGTTAESGITEKELTLDLALRLRRLLKGAPFKVLLTRDSDRWLSLEKRVGFANENKADLFLSIHMNWMEPHSIRALETYYVGPTDDPATLKLAERENKDSQYSFADYKKLLDKIYVDTRRHESHTLATTVQSQLFRALKTTNSKVENRGVKTAPFVVLIGTQMPAILVEVACLSNPDEVKLLSKDDYRERIAQGLARGIQNYANTFSTVSTDNRKGS